MTKFYKLHPHRQFKCMEIVRPVTQEYLATIDTDRGRVLDVFKHESGAYIIRDRARMRADEIGLVQVVMEEHIEEPVWANVDPEESQKAFLKLTGKTLEELKEFIKDG